MAFLKKALGGARRFSVGEHPRVCAMLAIQLDVFKGDPPSSPLKTKNVYACKSCARFMPRGHAETLSLIFESESQDT
jgi:hypothetical protein